jgi:hypothetical protein
MLKKIGKMKPYQLRSEEAQAALANMKDNTAVQERFSSCNMRLKLNMKQKCKIMLHTTQNNNKKRCEGKIGEDMNFSCKQR